MGYIWTERSAPGSTAHGIILARTWSGLTFPTPGDVPGPGIEFASPVALTLAGEFSTTEPSLSRDSHHLLTICIWVSKSSFPIWPLVPHNPHPNL